MRTEQAAFLDAWMMGRRGEGSKFGTCSKQEKRVLRLRGKACSLRTHIPQICFVAVNYSVEN
jgi:hypothetical protein